MAKQIRNPGVRFALGATGPYANKLGGGSYARAMSIDPIIPDDAWTIEDPATCSIDNHVITWNRLLVDSMIRLLEPTGFAAGQTWRVSYTVLDNTGNAFGLFCSSASSLFPSTNLPTDLGSQSQDTVSANNSFLIRWSPNAAFNNETLVIKDVRIKRIG